jgi:hypothetical protein
MTHAPPPPAQLEPYVRVLGVEDALLFFTTFGGAELYLAADPKGRSELARVLGIEKARALAEEDARHGLPRRVPLGKPWVAAVLFARGLSKSEIARRMHTTDVTVRKWLKASTATARFDPRQQTLF